MINAQELADWLREQIEIDVDDADEHGDELAALSRVSETLGVARFLDECELKKDLIEWALGIEHLRDVGDPDAPKHALGLDVLRMLAVVYEGREGFDEDWRPEN